MSTFKENREEFEQKAGGKDKILPQGVIVEWEKIDGVLVKITDGYDKLEPYCVCAQKSHTLHQVKSGEKGLIHWVGTCCIQVYRPNSKIGGKYGMKQQSYDQLIAGVEEIVNSIGGSINKARLKVMKERKQECWGYTMFRFTIEEHAWIEKLCSITIRKDWIPNIKGFEVKERYGY